MAWVLQPPASPIRQLMELAFKDAGMLCILPVRIKFALGPYRIITRKEHFPAPATKLFKDSPRSFALPHNADPAH